MAWICSYRSPLRCALGRCGLAVRSVATVRARSSHVDSMESAGLHLSWSGGRRRALFHLVVADLPVSLSRVAFFSALADRHGRRRSHLRRRLLLQAR